MTAPWLHIVGIGEDGLSGLSPAVAGVVQSAELIVGGARHLQMVADLPAEKRAWPTPFDTMIAELKRAAGRVVVVLVTGDPMWFSAGALLLRAFPRDEVGVYPHVSAFQLTAARLGWPLAEVETFTLHGRPVDLLRAHLSPNARLIALSGGSETAREVARILVETGYGGSILHALSHMGGAKEEHVRACAADWQADVPEFHTLAIECVAGPDARCWPRTGLPDQAFRHDGKMTKSEVRAVTLAALAPQPGELLWDIGSGCGSVGIEWMRAAPRTKCCALDPNAARRALAASNAQALGVPGLDVRDGRAPEDLGALPDADAIFVGGGLGDVMLEMCVSRLKGHGRLVANAVTLESEAILLDAYARHGGNLRKIIVQRAEPVGPLTGWRPLMPVTQWSVTK